MEDLIGFTLDVHKGKHYQLGEFHDDILVGFYGSMRSGIKAL